MSCPEASIRWQGLKLGRFPVMASTRNWMMTLPPWVCSRTMSANDGAAAPVGAGVVCVAGNMSSIIAGLSRGLNYDLCDGYDGGMMGGHPHPGPRIEYGAGSLPRWGGGSQAAPSPRPSPAVGRGGKRPSRYIPLVTYKVGTREVCEGTGAEGGAVASPVRSMPSRGGPMRAAASSGPSPGWRGIRRMRGVPSVSP